MILEKLAQRGHLGARRALDAYNENQPRDERGRWGEGAIKEAVASAHAQGTPEAHKHAISVIQATGLANKYSSQIDYHRKKIAEGGSRGERDERRFFGSKEDEIRASIGLGATRRFFGGKKDEIRASIGLGAKNRKVK